MRRRGHGRAPARAVRRQLSQLGLDEGRRSGDRNRSAPAPQPQAVRLWLLSDRDRVMVQIWDSDRHQPVRRNTGLDAEAGRGLLLIDAVSSQWGSYAVDGVPGKFVSAVCTR